MDCYQKLRKNLKTEQLLQFRSINMCRADTVQHLEEYENFKELR